MIEQATATAALMLGSDKSRGCCLQVICGIFWLGSVWTAALAKSINQNFNLL